ncbi:ribonuclease TUDOR 1-like [Apium graveolens]|uniref:ribonuclease TUDOR 1-like n=1 Tax=Apium graveolens TaxID=4045 RepID=UPI003D7903B9
MASRVIKAKAISRGIVKAVPYGDTLVIMEIGNTASPEIPTERTIILSSLMAPKLARRGDDQSTDEPFAWQSKEFEVGFQVDYTLSRRGLEFGTIFLDDKNVTFWIVAQGWLKTVRDLDKDKGGYSPFLKELKKWEENEKDNGAGCWSKQHNGYIISRLSNKFPADKLRCADFYAVMWDPQGGVHVVPIGGDRVGPTF